MKTDLQLSHFEVAPGHSTRVSIEVTNTAEVIDGVTAIVDGINPDWVRLERPLLSLFPDATDRLDLVIDAPKDCPAGDYLVVVRVVSTIDAERQTVHDFWLTVTPAPGLAISLVPQIVTGGSNATVVATVVNTGNTTCEPNIDAVDPTREIDCVADPSSVVIPQGHEAAVDITMRGKRPWFGEPVPHAVTITARLDDVVVEQTATFRQKPRVPRGVLTALILAAIVLLWALIFLFVISELRDQDSAAKAVGTGFANGPENIPLSRVAATAEGTVTASTTGEGIPRITVEALRINADGEPESVGSVATGDDGTYSLQSLIPGTYIFRYSADGYQTTWYEAALDEQSAEPVELTPLSTTDDLDVVLTGNLGSLSGQIAVPPDAVGVPLTVTATTTVTIDGVTTTQTVAETTTTDGSFTLTGLATPGTYEITVTGPGFATQQFEQTLAGGASTVVNTVDLVASVGSIEGVVRDGNGQPLGGVAVTARSGDLVIKSVTPTTGGNVGQFRIIGVPTPQTYALSFELAQFTNTTLALSLQAGEDRTGLGVTLFGGKGSVSGVAVSNGVPVGGAKVTVLGDGIASETTTLTAGGNAGSFTVTDLAVPGDYTVSIEAPGYQTETMRATFLGGAQQDFGRIELVRDSADIGGVVRGPSGGLGGATVTLSDGTARTRTTTTATNPVGAYTFAAAPPASYTLTAQAPGYRTKVVLIDVAAGADIGRDITLVPTAQSAAPLADASSTGMSP